MGRLKGDLRDRTYQLALLVLDLVDELPNNPKGWQLCRQLVASGTSIGANLEEADQALSVQDFIHKCSIARKEASETHFWLRLCRDKRLIKRRGIHDAEQFVKIILTIIKKSSSRQT